MKRWFRIVSIGILAISTALTLGLRPGIAEPHPRVYLFRGLADVFFTGMDTLADELNASAEWFGRAGNECACAGSTAATTKTGTSPTDQSGANIQLNLVSGKRCGQ
jgi:hypothetical protein